MLLYDENTLAMLAVASRFLGKKKSGCEARCTYQLPCLIRQSVLFRFMRLKEHIRNANVPGLGGGGLGLVEIYCTDVVYGSHEKTMH